MFGHLLRHDKLMKTNIEKNKGPERLRKTFLRQINKSRCHVVLQEGKNTGREPLRLKITTPTRATFLNTGWVDDLFKPRTYQKLVQYWKIRRNVNEKKTLIVKKDKSVICPRIFKPATNTSNSKSTACDDHTVS